MNFVVVYFDGFLFDSRHSNMGDRKRQHCSCFNHKLITLFSCVIFTKSIFCLHYWQSEQTARIFKFHVFISITELFWCKRMQHEHRCGGGGVGGGVCMSYWWIWSSPSMRWLTKAICSLLRMRRRQQESRGRPLEFLNLHMDRWMLPDEIQWFRPMLESMQHQHQNVVPYEQRQSLLRRTNELHIGHDVLS